MAVLGLDRARLSSLGRVTAPAGEGGKKEALSKSGEEAREKKGGGALSTSGEEAIEKWGALSTTGEEPRTIKEGRRVQRNRHYTGNIHVSRGRMVQKQTCTAGHAKKKITGVLAITRCIR